MKKSGLREKYGSYEKTVKMFFVQFDALFSMKKFGQHLLTLVLPKWPNPSKNGLKIGRNHDMSKWPGGFVVLRYRDPIFGPDGVQGVCSTLPKPLVHIYNTRGEIEF